ncbi:NAD(P)-binding domain protein [Metarhizium album ARSEF 1941]|uniref:NAD(P)-binding domain protein n=1 Tax=Metarhizium album (strain ARSEF 1941) TaxID=1081103 RepID=A0A0B2X7S0_METAS|nr:NAD(P)-binding domain protein [Metarhizium album ARSEF 1941]KHO01560.1 NAD(P)-binding domain protein [Metarhizium album ARSEF 1941]
MGDGSGLDLIALDLSRASRPEQVREAVADLGPSRIDVLVNNAGMSGPMATAGQAVAEDLRAAFEVNAIAPLMIFQGCCKSRPAPRSS